MSASGIMTATRTLCGRGRDSRRARQRQARAQHLKRVAVHECLGDEGASGVRVLDLLSSNVLTLAKFEDVLLAIDDAQGAIGQPFANVATERRASVAQSATHLMFGRQPV
jgi:hypothetical protein